MPQMGPDSGRKRTQEYTDPWNPPVVPGLPDEHARKQSLLAKGVASNSWKEMSTLGELTGKDPADFVQFTPARLALQQCILCVNFYVKIPGGEQSHRDFAANFKKTVEIVFEDKVQPNLPDIKDRVATRRDYVRRQIQYKIEALKSCDVPSHRTQLFWGWAMAGSDTGGYEPSDETYVNRVMSSSLKGNYDALVTAVENGLIEAESDKFWEALTRATYIEVDRESSSRVVGGIVGPIVRKAAEALQLGMLPVKAEGEAISILMKGAPAVGKTSYVPTVAAISIDQGIPWDEVMHVDPDLWRNLLLDPESLGPERPYFGQLTEKEVSMLSTRVVAALRSRWTPPRHLYFDHFLPDPGELASLSERSQTVHYIAMFASPEDSLRRSLKRGNEISRFISRESLLYTAKLVHELTHQLLFGPPNDNIIYHVVDNRVPENERAIKVLEYNTTYGEINIFHIRRYLELLMFSHLNPDAQSAEELFREAPSLEECIDPMLDFARKAMKDPSITLRFVERRRGVEHTYARFTKARGLMIGNQSMYDDVTSDFEANPDRPARSGSLQRAFFAALEKLHKDWKE